MKGKRIILTGAAGGIATHLARLLLAEGARLCLTDINEQALLAMRETLGQGDIATVAADITVAEGRQKVVDEAMRTLGGIDVLINSAGINPFGVFAKQAPGLIEKTVEINTLAPMLLARAVLPSMLEQDSGHIVNIGSTFGSIGFAWFTAYSASKYALRGFSQALRRELADTGVSVTYIAPRAVKTAINSQEVYEMAEAVKMNMDEPDAVAEQIV
ncbi:MAG: SDR family NAD(P)-dependent oxidoreductase, partial [Gammaproteobacteria bacterium]|nr:SDR family NAD(P)-dependent oxidoreductase [Gammaproteobacteria bacterium]